MSSGLYSGVSGLALGSGLYRNVSGLWGGASGLTAGFGGGSPYGGASLYLDFLSMTAPTFDNRITFTRGSNATLTDSTGKITYAPANLVTYSQEFDNAAWTKNNPGVAALPVVTANAGVAPDGTTTADRIQFNCVDVGSAVNRSLVTTNPSQPTGVNYVGSVWVKAYDVANVGKTLRFAVDAFGSGVFTLTSEWQRIKINGLATATVGNFILETRGTFTTQTADALVWGAQLEPVTYQTTPGTYVATTSSAYYGPRFDYDPVTLAAKGLLIEEARTNLLTYSEQFDNAAWTKTRSSITANATTSPDGMVDADKLVEDTTAASTHFTTQTATVASGATVTCSVYAKAAERTRVVVQENNSGATVTVNLANGSIISGSGTAQDAGNGWYRISVTGTVPATTAIMGIYLRDATSSSYTGNGTSGIYIWGAQLEAGAFATSYIPTVASTVTRSADVATMTGTNFSSWYNQPTGTFVVSLTPRGVPTGGANVRFLEVNDGTVTSRNPLMYASSANIAYTQYRVAGVDQANINSSASYYVANSTITIGAAYAVNDFATSFSGGAVTTDTSGSVVTNASELDIGYARSAAGTEVFNGHIRQIAYFNTRLPDAQLQTLTAPSAVTTLSLDFTSGSYTVGY